MEEIRNSTGLSASATSPERQSAPDIVVSSSPTFKRRKGFKEAARKRSLEKSKQKKSKEIQRASMESESVSIVEESEMNKMVEDVSVEDEISETSNSIVVISAEAISETVETVGVSELTISEDTEETRPPVSLSLELSQLTSPISSPSQETTQSPTESVRDILIQKRVSLSHTPDIVRVFQKCQQQQEQHEFQKVKSELKRVEETNSISDRRYSAQSHFNGSQIKSNMTVDKTEIDQNSASDQLRRSNSKDLILDLVPAPVENIMVNSEESSVSMKTTSKKKAVKKERSQTTMIAGVREEVELNKKSSVKAKGDTKASDKKSCTTAPSDSMLQSSNLIKSVKSGNGNKNSDKKQSALGNNGAVESLNGKPDRNANNKPLRSRSASPDKKVSGLKQNKNQARDKNQFNGENKENGVPNGGEKTTAGNPRGGFLAPTKSWLLYMGNQVDLKSRSPSPGLSMKERSPSPRRHFRESSSESDREKSRKLSVGPGSANRKTEKDPNLPIVKRSNSVKKKPSANGIVEPNKKSVSSTSTQDRAVRKTSQSTEKKNSMANGLIKRDGSVSKQSRESISSNTKGEEMKMNGKRPSPPPVAPKPTSKKTSNNAFDMDRTVFEASSSWESSLRSLDSTSVMTTSTEQSSKQSMQRSHESSSVSATLESATLTSAVSETSALSSTAATAVSATTTSKIDTSAASKSSSTTFVNSTQVGDAVSALQVSDISGSDIVTTSTGATGECGVVETSVTASEVIQKFEKVSKTSMSSSMTSSNLFQDTVSSRLKKISAEEFIANERKTSSSTGKSSTVESIGEINKKESMSKKSVSEKIDVNAISSETSSINSNTKSIEKVTQKALEKTGSHSQLGKSAISTVSSSNIANKKSNANESSEPSKGQIKGKMVVRLHPGQSRRLSAILDNKEENDMMNVRSWTGDVQQDDNPTSICGLEISFSSIIPQDIDIKLIPSSHYSQANNPDIITDSLKTT